MCEGIVEELLGIDLGDKRLNRRSALVVEAQQHTGPRADDIIRAKEDLRTLERDPEAGPAAYVKVRDEVSRAKWLGTRTLKLSTTPKRAARQAHLEIRAITVEVQPPHARARLPSVTHNVVLVEEVGGPGDGTTDVSWLLLTTLPIETLNDILRVIDCYVARWAVEIYFRTLKTGCRVEDVPLETNHRLKNGLAFHKIIAWRILFLTYLNRTCPKLPCTAVFADSEGKSVWRVVKKKPLPKTPPVLSDFPQLLTQRGGYNNRATELPPRPTTPLDWPPPNDRRRHRLARFRSARLIELGINDRLCPPQSIVKWWAQPTRHLLLRSQEVRL